MTLENAKIITASVFEVIPNQRSRSDSKLQMISGYISPADDSDILSAMCGSAIEKLTVLYNDYCFSLLDVSLTNSHPKGMDKTSGVTFSFHAKDVILERVSYG